MKCILCGSETHAGEVMVTLNRGETVVIIKGVPAQVCENCGEYFLSKEVTAVVLGRAEEAVAKGAEVEPKNTGGHGRPRGNIFPAGFTQMSAGRC